MLNQLIFFITYKCNFRCKTCFYAGTMDKNAAVRELSIGQISKVSSSMGRLDRLLISGGEPFLREDLPEICEIFYLQNKVSSIHLPTNGYYTKKISNFVHKILLKCPKSGLAISLSLDGLQETHDKIKGVKGSFERSIETAQALSALKKEFTNLNIYIITVVNNANLHEILDLADFVKNNLTVDGHGPSPMRGRPYDEALLSPSYEEWEELSKKLMKYHSHWNKNRPCSRLRAFLADNRTGYLYNIYTRVLKGEKLPFKCQAGNVIGVLGPNGDVKLCELTEAVGNVNSADFDFKAIWRSDKANKTRQKIKDCACTHACFLAPSIEMNPLSLVKSCFFG